MAVSSGWQLAVGRRWRLAVVGGWRLVAVGDWWLAVDGPLGQSLRAVLNQKKKFRSQRTALPGAMALNRTPLLIVMVPTQHHDNELDAAPLTPLPCAGQSIETVF